MAGPSLRRLLIKNTLVQIAAQLVSLLIGLATAAALSRYLGVEGFGQLNYIFAFFYFFLSINDFGVNTVVVREISKQRERAEEIIGTMLSFKVLLATISVLAAWTTIWFMDFPEPLRNALFVFALVLPMIALQLPAVIFQVLLKAAYPAVMGIFNRCAGFLLMIGAVWLGWGLTGIVSAFLLAEFASLLIMLKYTRGFVRPIWRLDPKLWQEVLRSSVPLGIAGFFVALINRVDFIMLEKMTDLRQVGLYSAAYKVTNLLEAFPLMMMGTIYPLMSRYATADLGQLRELYKKSVFYLGLVALPMGLGITLLAPVIIQVLFGANFIAADRGLMVLVWSTVFLCLALSGGNLLICLGKERISLVLNALGVGLNIMLNLLLIPMMGFVGAALATAATYLFILIGISLAAPLVLASARAETVLAKVGDSEGSSKIVAGKHGSSLPSSEICLY